MNKEIIIVVDAMGGDNYPTAPVLGSLMALKEYPDIKIKLLGDPGLINQEMDKKQISLRYGNYYDRIIIVDAPEIVPMDIQNPSSVLNMRGSSIFIGTGMSRLQQADGFVSAGNTGAVMAAALMCTGRITGIKRPALALVVPTKNGPCVILDVGANSANIPLHLIQFAIMGSIYSAKVQGISSPRIGLMSVGEEANKGNELVQITNKNLKILGDRGLINFIGNVQGNDIFAGTADVIVMDGFTGNTLLKLAESLLPVLKEALKKKLHDSSIFRQTFAVISQMLLKPTIASIKTDFDYQKYGGAPLLGVNGVIIVAHGKSTPLALMHAVGVARRAVQNDMVQKIEHAVSDLPQNILNLKPDSK